MLLSVWKVLSSRPLNKKRLFRSSTLVFELFIQDMASLILVIETSKCKNAALTMRLIICVAHRWCKRDSWFDILFRKALIIRLLFAALSRVMDMILSRRFYSSITSRRISKMAYVV